MFLLRFEFVEQLINKNSPLRNVLIQQYITLYDNPWTQLKKNLTIKNNFIKIKATHNKINKCDRNIHLNKGHRTSYIQIKVYINFITDFFSLFFKWWFVFVREKVIFRLLQKAVCTNNYSMIYLLSKFTY